MALAAGGKKIVFSRTGATVTDNKTGTRRTFRRTGRGLVQTKKEVFEKRTKTQEIQDKIKEAQLKAIDRDKRLNEFQKEDRKRELLGITNANLLIFERRKQQQARDLKQKEVTARLPETRALSKRGLGVQKNLPQRQLLTKPKKTVGEIKPAPQTKRARLQRYLSPNKADWKIVKIAKGPSEFVVTSALGLWDLAKLVKSGDIKNVNLRDVGKGIVEYGPEIRKDLLSGDAHRISRGFTDIAAYLTPVKMPIGKAASKIANSATKFRTTTNIATGSTKIELRSYGITQGNQRFIQRAKLRYNPRTRNIIGNIRTTVGKKKFYEIINLKKQPGFYVDVKTGNKYPIKIVHGSKGKLTMKEIKTKQTTPDKIFIEGNSVRKGAIRDVEVKTTKIVETDTMAITGTKTRISEVKYISDLEKAGGKIKPQLSVLETFKKPITEGKITAAAARQILKTQKLTAKQLKKVTGLTDKQIKDFLKFMDYDKEIINGLDRRTRIARALGLRKDNKLVKMFDIALKDFAGSKVGITKQIKGKIVVTGEDIVINPILARSGFGRNFLIKKNKLSKAQKTKLGKINRDITIPDLTARITFVKKLKLRGILGPVVATKIITKLQARKIKLGELERKLKGPQKKLKTKQAERIRETKKPITKTKQIMKKVTIKKPITKSKSKTKTISKTKQIKIRQKKILDLIRLKKPLLLPLPDDDLKSIKQLPRGYKYAYNILIKKQGKIQTQRKYLPLNMAYNELAKIIDNTLVRSAQLKAAGFTRKKDVKALKSLKKKIRMKKSNNPLVLLLVEKRKFALDTKGEKKQIKKAKRKLTPKQKSILLKRLKKARAIKKKKNKK